MAITRRGHQLQPVQVLTSSAGVLTINLNMGRYFQVTLTENITNLVIEGSPPPGFGASFILWIIQNQSTAKTMNMPSNLDWDGGLVGAISTTPGAIDILACTTRNGTSWDATISKGRA